MGEGGVEPTVLFGRVPHGALGLSQRRPHDLEGLHQVAHLVVTGVGDGKVEVLLRNLLRCSVETGQGGCDALGKKAPRRYPDATHEPQGEHEEAHDAQAEDGDALLDGGHDVDVVGDGRDCDAVAVGRFGIGCQRFCERLVEAGSGQLVVDGQRVGRKLHGGS